jgi:hypothetical protein
MVKFAQKCSTKAGKVLNKPKVIGIKGKVQDTNGFEINDEINVGNGTLGHLQFRPVDFGANGIYLYPNAICITNLVEYASVSADLDFSEFDLEELDDVGTEENLNDDDFDDSFPF